MKYQMKSLDGILIKLLSGGIQKIPPILVKFQKLHRVPNLMISGTDYPKDNFVIHGGFLIEILLYRRTSTEVRHVYRKGEKFR